MNQYHLPRWDRLGFGLVFGLVFGLISGLIFDLMVSISENSFKGKENWRIESSLHELVRSLASLLRVFRRFAAEFPSFQRYHFDL